ncbi:MAG: cytochrome d ubiquinol oxidase subunit II [Acidimicrobiales bacterium]|nr:cytochrome d ubiquinol oxidase subunit II [Acidimicrobiales bacterium]
MGLEVFWFVIVALLWTGYFVLEGFDFGVGMLAPIVGTDDVDRRVAINTIGPLWDGNEVWVITAGAAMFAAFPDWYATMFSGFYVALVLVLVVLILRGVAFEFRSKSPNTRWRGTWDVILAVCSALAPFLWGVALANLVRGVPIDEAGNFTGTFFTLLNPYALAAGVTLTLLCAFHGASYLGLRTDGEVRRRAERIALRLGLLTAVVTLLFGVWTHVVAGRGVLPGPAPVLSLLLLFAAAVLVRDERFGWAFTATSVAIALTVATFFVDLYPNVMVSSTDEAYNLTVAGAAAGSYSLTVMTIVAVVFLPVVLLYQGWTYWVFRARVTRADLEGVRTPLDALDRRAPAGGAPDGGGPDAPTSGVSPSPAD